MSLRTANSAALLGTWISCGDSRALVIRKPIAGLPFHDEAAKIDDTYLTGKLSVNAHPFVEHFKFVKALEDANTVAKQMIPALRNFWNSWSCP